MAYITITHPQTLTSKINTVLNQADVIMLSDTDIELLPDEQNQLLNVARQKVIGVWTDLPQVKALGTSIVSIVYEPRNSFQFGNELVWGINKSITQGYLIAGKKQTNGDIEVYWTFRVGLNGNDIRTFFAKKIAIEIEGSEI